MIRAQIRESERDRCPRAYPPCLTPPRRHVAVAGKMVRNGRSYRHEFPEYDKGGYSMDLLVSRVIK